MLPALLNSHYCFLSDYDHLACQSDHPLGCDCCRIEEPSIFCDIHSPEHFVKLSAPMSKQPPAPQHSRIPKYSRVPSDLAIRDALDDWHEEKTSSVYGWHHLCSIRPCIVMSDGTVDRIVDCTHHCKIQSLADLKKETGWIDVDQFGNEVIAIILRHVPLPASPFVSTPLRPTAMSGILNVADSPVSSRHPAVVLSVNGPSAKHVIRCSACGQDGHNGN